MSSCLEESSSNVPVYSGYEANMGIWRVCWLWGGAGTDSSNSASWPVVYFTCSDRWRPVPDCLTSVLPPSRDRQEMPCLWEARPCPELDPTWCCVLIAQSFRPQTVSHADEQQLPFGRVVSSRAATTAFFVQQGGQLLVRE